MPSSAAHREGDVAEVPVCYTFADGDDFAGTLVADGSGEFGELAVFAFEDVNVGGVDRGGEHAQEDLARGRGGQGRFNDADSGRGAKAFKLGRVTSR